MKILRTLEAADARLSGVVSVGGLIDAGTLRLSGRLDAVGGIRVRDRFEYRGEVRALASVEAGEIDGAGTLVVREAARVRGLLRSVGTLRISADLSAGRFVGEGEFEVSGSVVAPEVDFRFDRPSKAAAIRAEWVRIRRGPGLPIPLPPILPGASRPACSVARIEAVEADLEGVECDFLRAERISLGPGCHVARLEGTIVRKHPDAWVGPESRSPPPPGLFR